MGIEVVGLGDFGDTTARSEYTCPIVQPPAANSLVMVSVLVSGAAGVPVEPTSVVGAGLTFSIATSSVTFAPTTVGQETLNLSLWRAMGAAPDGSIVTATFPSAASGCAILVDQVSGVSKAGANGEKALSGSSTSRVNNNSALTVFFPSATSTANGWFATGAHADTTDGAASPNYNSSSSQSFSTPASCVYSTWTTLSTATLVVFTSNDLERRGGIAMELVADNPGPTVAGQWAQGMTGFVPEGFAPRIRGDLWVESGHARNTEPYTDTRER